MGILRRGHSYDRRKLLSQASKARARGRLKKAIRLYRRILAVEPEDPEVHRKVAPLLARSRQREAALTSFSQAVSGLMRRGFEDRALGVCRETVQYFPHRADVWEAIAQLELKRSRTSDAVKALCEGRGHCSRRSQRGDALRLLRRAHELAPDDADIAVDLARLLRRSGARLEARRLLAGFAARAKGPPSRRVAWARLCVDPTPARLLGWLRPGRSG